MMSLRLLAAAACACVAVSPALSGDVLEKFDPRIAGFHVLFHGESTGYRDAFVAAMPGAAVIFDVAGPAGEYTLATEHGTAVQQSKHQWRWTAPARATGSAAIRSIPASS